MWSNIIILQPVLFCFCGSEFMGEPGSTGSTGYTGPAGQTGATGSVGATGWTGKPGLNGSNGEMGSTGVSGYPGATGSTGTVGATGSPGSTGIQGPAGRTGATGSPGPMGNPGPSGLTGRTGGTGAQGAPGQRGERGSPGERGHPGERGPAGVPGPAGSRGERGFPGPAGPSGPTGPSGPAGPTGPVGPRGPAGGATGSTGATGMPGPPLHDRDECAEGVHQCHSLCINTFGSYRCDCYPGYKLASNRRACLDVNECDHHNGYCEHKCRNTQGSYQCWCKDGYMLAENQFTCVSTATTTALPQSLTIITIVFAIFIFFLLVSNFTLIGIVHKTKRRYLKSSTVSTRSKTSLPSFADIHGNGFVTNGVNGNPWPHQQLLVSTNSRSNQALPRTPDEQNRDLHRQSSYSGYLQPFNQSYMNDSQQRAATSENGPIYLELGADGAGYQGLDRGRNSPRDGRYEKVTPPTDDLKKGHEGAVQNDLKNSAADLKPPATDIPAMKDGDKMESEKNINKTEKRDSNNPRYQILK